MGFIERIKSALGLGTSASSPGSTSGADRRDDESGVGSEPTPVSEIEGDDDVETTQTVVDPGDRGDGTDVTVEHEPDTRSEDAVKGTDTADVGSSADVEPAESATDEPDTETGADSHEPDVETDSDAAGESADAAPAADLEDIKGIGPAYAGRLRDAGIEDVAALAAADAVDLADRTDLGEGRLQTFIDRAAAK
jgi:predicted flap endonuclease-1-like 5' DNA nuclease